MALSSTMDRKNSYGRIKNRNKAIEKRRQGAPLDTRAAFAYMTILLLISLPAFIYLYQNACITQKGYQVQKLEERYIQDTLSRPIINGRCRERPLT
jgi:hypothetical protein